MHLQTTALLRPTGLDRRRIGYNLSAVAVGPSVAVAGRTRTLGVIRGDGVALRAGRPLVSAQRGPVVAVVVVHERVPGRKAGMAGVAGAGGHLLRNVIERGGARREVAHVARLALRSRSADSRVLHRCLRSPGSERRMAGRAGRGELVGDVHGRGARGRHRQGGLVTPYAIW